MNLMNNTLIKASAGTGKTYTLATRMIRMLLTGVEPQTIVALTFSRAAAGEIFSKLAERLAAASLTEEGAAEESQTVFRGISPELKEAIVRDNGSPLTCGCFRKLLRRVIESQHVSMIGTLDSFMFHMVQSFPLELGFQGATSMMDTFEIERQVKKSVALILYRKENTKEITDFMEAFRLAIFGKESKTCFSSLIQFVNDWHSAWTETEKYGEQAWGQPDTIWPGGSLWQIAGSLSDLADQLRKQITPIWQREYPKGAEQWEQFCCFVENFNNTLPTAPAGIANVLKAYTPETQNITIKYGRKELNFSGHEGELIISTIETLFALILKACCSTTQGIYKIISAYEKVYNANTRHRGMMTFSDIPELISGLDSSIRQNIEYRFDTRFQHWALDEFQDTSHSQWNAVKELVDEVIQSADEERSLFIVGDVKQAIYGWRGGDVAIFNNEADSGMYNLQNLSISYRYSPEIADLVNLVFNGAHIARCLGESASGAGQLWSRNWVAHESRQAPGYVSIERVEKAPKGTPGITSWIERTCAILQESEPWMRGISTAILVRSNIQGATFADALKAAGIPAVWEGENSICDTPVVNALLHVLLVAEHPGNTLAWQHICVSPLAQSVFKNECALSPVEGAAALSTRVLADISKKGLSRSLRGYIEGSISKGLDEFTGSRLDDLIRAASAFSARPDSENSLTDFAAFAETFVNRDKAGASTVKILTVHRSKGLGFDYVILPIIESIGFTTMREDTALRDKDNRWILHTPPKLLREHDPVLADAWQHTLNNSVFEQLCVKYVSMTRAKRAMTVLLKPPAGKSTKTEYFSDYMQESLPENLPYSRGDHEWYCGYTAEAPIEQSEVCSIASIKREKREEVSRMTPSRTVMEGMNAADLFSRSESGAMLKGTRIHDALSQIEWLTPPFNQPTQLESSDVDLASPSALRDALTKPAEATDLWRERSFEIKLDGRWVSGTFDRVVFSGSRENLTAEIMDFKTNRMRSGETTESFHQRMTETYKAQMELYREALEQLAVIPAERITTTLLLTATREIIR